jgi:chromosome segregation ATPase
VAMTDNDRSVLQDLADSVIGWAPSINAARAALAEIDERNRMSISFQRDIAFLSAEMLRLRNNHDNAHEENNRLRLEAMDLRKELGVVRGEYEKRIEGLGDINEARCKDLQDVCDKNGRLAKQVLDLKAKLAAPPETLAITEIHNRLAKLENNAVNDRMFLGSVRVDVSDLERDVKSIGEDVITLEESTVPDMKARITNIEASVIDLRKPRTFTIV